MYVCVCVCRNSKGITRILVNVISYLKRVSVRIYHLYNNLQDRNKLKKHCHFHHFWACLNEHKASLSIGWNVGTFSHSLQFFQFLWIFAYVMFNSCLFWDLTFVLDRFVSLKKHFLLFISFLGWEEKYNHQLMS